LPAIWAIELAATVVIAAKHAPDFDPGTAARQCRFSRSGVAAAAMKVARNALRGAIWKGRLKPSRLEAAHVMRAMGIPHTAVHGAIRFSLSRETTAEEIERSIAAAPPIVAQLRH